MSGLSSDFEKVRTGEKSRRWYRSGRVFKNQMGWYFQTREGIDVGPYACEFDAEVDLETLIASIKGATSARVLQAIHAQKVGASSGDYMNSSAAYIDYLVEEGGIELLRKSPR
ncbi:MAG: hypothetical protein ACI9ON_004075 [Limisphaerales bacterium]|jgi:hypothetical protein